MNKLFTVTVISDEAQPRMQRWDLLSLLQQITNHIAPHILESGRPGTEQTLQFTLIVRITRIDTDSLGQYAMLLPPHIVKPLRQEAELIVRSAEIKQVERRDD